MLVPGRHDGPWAPIPERSTASGGGGGVSLLLAMELEHPGAGQEAFIPVSPLFSLLSPGSSTSSALSRSPASAASPLLSPQDTREMPTSPCFGQPHVLAEAMLFLSIN